jgi:transaldolase
VFAGPRWEALAAKGARAQRPLWASTGVKNPDYSDTLYVSELVVAGAVNTMPEQTLLAFADHGELHPDNNGDTVTDTAAQAQEVFDAVAAAGVDITNVFLVRENEGVDKFEKSWSQLWNTVTDQLGKAG